MSEEYGDNLGIKRVFWDVKTNPYKFNWAKKGGGTEIVGRVQTWFHVIIK